MIASFSNPLANAETFMIGAWKSDHNLLGLLVHHMIRDAPVLQPLWKYKQVIEPDKLRAPFCTQQLRARHNFFQGCPVWVRVRVRGGTLSPELEKKLRKYLVKHLVKDRCVNFKQEKVTKT